MRTYRFSRSANELCTRARFWERLAGIASAAVGGCRGNQAFVELPNLVTFPHDLHSTLAHPTSTQTAGKRATICVPFRPRDINNSLLISLCATCAVALRVVLRS